MPNIVTYRSNRRLGRKKAADPKDWEHLARDNPKTHLVADPRDTGIIHPAMAARIKRAGQTLTQRAMSLAIPEWAADLPHLTRAHKRSPLFPLNQDGESSCVGNGHVELVLAGPIMQEKFIEHLARTWGIMQPVDKTGTYDLRALAELVAHVWYKKAQDLDEWPGSSYDGTSVRAGAKVGQQLGLWPEYTWLTSVIEVARYIILHGPVVIGIDMFTSDMDPTEFVKGRKDTTALLTGKGIWEGGHCMLMDLADIKRSRFGGPQTWGDSPQFSPYERWEMDFDAFAYRLSQGADALAIPEVRLPV